jgi:hypothetical protein
MEAHDEQAHKWAVENKRRKHDSRARLYRGYCSDENPVNDYEDHGGPRCSRCALIEAKTSQYLEYDVKVTLKKASYES